MIDIHICIYIFYNFKYFFNVIFLCYFKILKLTRSYFFFFETRMYPDIKNNFDIHFFWFFFLKKCTET